MSGERYNLLYTVSKPALGPTQPPIQWVRALLSRGCDPVHFLVPRIRICGAMLALSLFLHGVMLNFKNFSFIGSESKETSALISCCRTSVYLLYLSFRHYTNTVLLEVSYSLSITFRLADN